MAHHASTHGHHSDHGHHDHGHEHHEVHGGSTAQYLAVFAALCVLTGASFFTTSSYWPYHSNPKVGWAFMMAVSCTKALLVMLFFMHLLWEASWKYVLTLPAMFMSVFLGLMLVPDVGWRLQSASEERLMHMAKPKDQEKEASHDDGHDKPHAPADHAGGHH